ncbi:glycolate oxidase subunit GlcE [Fluviibacterium sp. DFM31]|uniref:Glycolate oxidase subunit GlcE n=1 Tax=Meridianimarinicoccus marinus TaxID=3231483 RepID=A0ABV3LBR4_9RHOB
MNAFAAPADESAISEAVRDASAQNIRLRLVAGGTRSTIGKPLKDVRSLDLAANAGITRYEPGALTIEARAGTPIREIEAALAAENQMLPFEPVDHRALLGGTGEPTVGGVVACNISGPRRFLSGACRDFLLGVRLVDGRGRILKNGGRVMKNVTGLDLTKLSCGAYGTLGIVTEVSLKVLPRSERSVTLQFAGVDVPQAARLFARTITTPFEVSGASWMNGIANLRVEGLGMQVDYRLSKLRALFPDYASSVLEGDAHHSLWAAVRDVHVFAGGADSVWRVSVKPTDAPKLVAELKTRLSARAMLDQGGAVVWLAVPSDSPDQAVIVRGAIPGGQGYATLVRGNDALRLSVPAFQPQHPRLEQISEGLRRQFDPQQILNPGLMAA